MGWLFPSWYHQLILSSKSHFCNLQIKKGDGLQEPVICEAINTAFPDKLRKNESVDLNELLSSQSEYCAVGTIVLSKGLTITENRYSHMDDMAVKRYMWF
jgi:hypothetical protein